MYASYIHLTKLQLVSVPFLLLHQLKLHLILIKLYKNNNNNNKVPTYMEFQSKKEKNHFIQNISHVQ